MRFSTVGMLVVAVAAWAGAAPATAPATARGLPQAPGFHDLYHTVQVNGQSRRMAYNVYLPRGFDPSRTWPLVVYLVGVGDRGDNHQGIFNNGPPTQLRTDAALADWAPFIVLTPQCPADLRWESAGMPQAVMDFVELAKASWSIDADRVYLTGLSMGGRGVWHVALAAPPGTFAVVNPICAIEVEAERMSEAVRGSTVLIVCGGNDREYTAGSRRMHQSLRDKGVDVVYVEVPGMGHGVWKPYYASRAFYEYLLMHRRGQKPPTSRPGEEQLVAISRTAGNSADARLAGPLKQFLPWWHVSNCGRENAPGLRDEALGRKGVFVTTPLSRTVPCRLMYTCAAPPDKKSTLSLTVAAHPQGQWELVVRANNRERLKRTIGSGGGATQPADAPGVWEECSVDLSDLAGQEVHVEVIGGSTGSAHPEAYWGKVELISR